MIKLNISLKNIKERNQKKRNQMFIFIGYIKDHYILFDYLEPSHCVKQRNVNARELLKCKKEK